MAESDRVVSRALAALREITLPADVARSAHDTADEIERTWRQPPYVVAFEGDVQARTELVNTLCGERLLDPFARAPGSATLRLRHGDKLACRVRYTDRTHEDRPIPEPEPISDFGIGEREDEVRTQLAGHQKAQEEVERALPVLVRKRPAAWAIWLWFVRAFLLLAHREKLATWRARHTATAESRRKLASIEEYAVQREKRERAAREKYYGEVRAYASGGPAGEGVCEVELVLPALPVGVDLVESAIAADLTIDASKPLDTTTLVDAAAAARAAHLEQRALAALQRLRGDLDEVLSRAEAELRERLGQVEKYALTIERTRYTAVQLDRIKPHLLASTTAAMEHASTHLGASLAELANDWVGKVAAATNTDELKAAITAIEDQWQAAPQRIADEVRMLAMGGAGGVARDLYPELVAPLREYGLPEQHLQMPKRAPVVGAVALLPSLANPSTAKVGGSWLTGLFKSFDSRRTAVREQVHARVEHMREVAAAELLDAEPKLHAAIGQALAVELGRALDLQREWYTQRIAEEREAIELARAKLLPLYAQRDAIDSELSSPSSSRS